MEFQGYPQKQTYVTAGSTENLLETKGTIKWVKLEDATTKFFHVNTTIRHKGKLITQLETSNATVLTSHRDKELLLWNEFKQRLRTSEFSGFFCQPLFFHG